MSLTICTLCGGVGGARAALALMENLPSEDLTFVVNTGDDFTHLGLEVWPDWDTVIYTLTGLGDNVRGWGRADEGTRVMEELRRLGAPDWFHLGDRDLGLHVVRHWALSQGRGKDEVARHIANALNVKPRVVRLTEDSLRTEFLLADETRMDFQTWFVRHQGKPAVARVDVPGAVGAVVTPGVIEAIEGSDLLLIAPSNPYLSIGPMLEVAEVAAAVKGRAGPTWAVSPLVGGKAIKGPLDALIARLSASSGQQSVVDAYEGWAQRLLLPSDEHHGLGSGLKLEACRTMLSSPELRAEFVTDLLNLWTRLR